jgi:hypothetical protein
MEKGGDKQSEEEIKGGRKRVMYRREGERERLTRKYIETKRRN